MVQPGAVSLRVYSRWTITDLELEVGSMEDTRRVGKGLASSGEGFWDSQRGARLYLGQEVEGTLCTEVMT